MRIPKFAYYLAKAAYKVLAPRAIVLGKKSRVAGRVGGKWFTFFYWFTFFPRVALLVESCKS